MRKFDGIEENNSAKSSVPILLLNRLYLYKTKKDEITQKDKITTPKSVNSTEND